MDTSMFKAMVLAELKKVTGDEAIQADDITGYSGPGREPIVPVGKAAVFLPRTGCYVIYKKAAQ